MTDAITKLRWWLICKLAGERMIMLNVALRPSADGRVRICGRSGDMVCGGLFEPVGLIIERHTRAHREAVERRRAAEGLRLLAERCGVRSEP